MKYVRMNRYLAISAALLATAVASWWIFLRRDDARAVELPSVQGNQRWVHAPTNSSSTVHSSPPDPAIITDETQEKTVGSTSVDATTTLENPDDWAAVVRASAVDRTAARSLAYVATLCRTLRGSRAKSDRFKDARWIAIAQRCPEDLPDSMTILTNSIPPDSPAMRQLRHAVESGDVAKRDAVAKSLLESSNDPDELESASSVYFDAERLRALGGDDRPGSLAGNDGALSLQIDLSLLISCSLGTDCAAQAPITLTQCVTTSLCYPGQSMRQIIAMRRSPEEMAYLDRLLTYVHQMRTEPSG
jgi:hypothetical protein